MSDGHKLDTGWQGRLEQLWSNAFLDTANDPDGVRTNDPLTMSDCKMFAARTRVKHLIYCCVLLRTEETISNDKMSYNYLLPSENLLSATTAKN